MFLDWILSNLIQFFQSYHTLHTSGSELQPHINILRFISLKISSASPHLYCSHVFDAWAFSYNNNNSWWMTQKDFLGIQEGRTVKTNHKIMKYMLGRSLIFTSWWYHWNIMICTAFTVIQLICRNKTSMAQCLLDTIDWTLLDRTSTADALEQWITVRRFS